jgi:Putative Ig domain
MPNINETVDSCPSYQPPWKLQGRISATRQVSVTYQWTRSDGTSTTPQVITVGGGADAEVTDTVPPPDTGAYPFTDTLRVTSPFSVSGSVRVYYYCGWPQVWIKQFTLPGGLNGKPYSYTLTGSGGDGMYSWSATGLPPGLSINSTTGVISGVPQASFAAGLNATTYPVTVFLHYPAGTSQQGAISDMSIEIYR